MRRGHTREQRYLLDWIARQQADMRKWTWFRWTYEITATAAVLLFAGAVWRMMG